jgi:acyl dehydratase
LRGDGGHGGTISEAPAPHTLPDRPADKSLSLSTLPQSALIYRLSGDYNPIHADPVLARKAGFDRPILHGLCTLGVATRAVLNAYTNGDPSRLRSLQLRFSAPVYPGETIATEFWQDGNVVSFRATATERGVVVLNNGRAVITD